jgi:phosphate transport system protein
MPRLPASSKLRKEYNEELNRLEEQALGGFDLVIRSLERTVEAVENQDIELAGLVVRDGQLVDARYLEVHQGLITLLATQSPVATDLRLITALLHVIKNIERMGAQCVNICKVIPLTGHRPPVDSRMIGRIVAKGRHARILVAQARRSFADRDVDLALNLETLDDQIDTGNRECFTLAIEIGDDPDRREWAMTMLLAARAIERIGDNAVDVGEQVVFVVTGLFRESEGIHDGSQ